MYVLFLLIPELVKEFLYNLKEIMKVVCCFLHLRGLQSLRWQQELVVTLRPLFQTRINGETFLMTGFLISF